MFPSAVRKIVSTEGSEHRFLSLLVPTEDGRYKTWILFLTCCLLCYREIYSAGLLPVQGLDRLYILPMEVERTACVESLHKGEHDGVVDVGM